MTARRTSPREPDRPAPPSSSPLLPEPVAKAHLATVIPGDGRGHAGVRRVSRAHSRFVTLLKVVLPMTALGLVVLLAAWPMMQEAGRTTPSVDKGQLEMVNARYFSVDDANQPFSVTAESAVQSADEPGIVDLVKPETEMTQADGKWVFLRSERGRYNQDSGLLLLVESVKVFQDDGYEFTTDEAHVQARQGDAWGDHAVVGQGPFGEIHAQGFRIVERGRTVVFTGASTMTLPGSSSGAGAAGGTR